MTSTDIQNLIVSTASSYGVDPRLALEVAITESGLDPNAVSPAGAVGIFQLMPATAQGLGVQDSRDPAQNIDGGVRYLSQLLSQFGDVSQVLGAFNWGMGNVVAAVAQYGSDWLSYAPAETQNYVAKIESAIGTQYTVSAGTTAAPASPAAAPDFTTGTVSEAGFVPSTSTGLSFTAMAVLIGAGLFLLWAMGE